MVAIFRRGYDILRERPAVRMLLQTVVSVILIALLLRVVQNGHVVASLMSLQPTAVAEAATLMAVGYLLNARRWQFLLHNVGIRERLSNLATLYFIGQFFSLFLPTSAGGDAVRVYHVARQTNQLPKVLIATFQERLFGLAASLLIGLVATLYYLPIVPPQLRTWVILMQIAGAVLVAVLLYPSKLIAVAGRISQRYDKRQVIERLATHPRAVAITQAVHSVASLPALTVGQFLVPLGMATTSTLLGIGMYYVFGLSLGIHASFIALCLVVPLVWIIRMAPVSLNGIGVGEGAFVFLMNIFAVPAGQSLALALAILALQTSFALFGGVLLALRVMRGTWLSTQRLKTVEDPTSM